MFHVKHFLRLGTLQQMFHVKQPHSAWATLSRNLGFEARLDFVFFVPSWYFRSVTFHRLGASPGMFHVKHFLRLGTLQQMFHVKQPHSAWATLSRNLGFEARLDFVFFVPFVVFPQRHIPQNRCFAGNVSRETLSRTTHPRAIVSRETTALISP